MKLKKILAGALAAVIAVGSLSAAAFAETDASGDYEYEALDDGTVSITKYLGKDENVVIPATIDGMDVTVIGGSAFSNNSDIVTVKIPDSVTEIGTTAFFLCSSLEEIELSEGLTTIGARAFHACFSLTEIVIPDSVTEIGNIAFYDCQSLTSIVIGEGNANYTSDGNILFNKDKTSLVWYPSAKTNTVYTIPDNVTEIGDYAFFSNTALKEVVIPDGVTAIGEYAFYSCVSLEKLAIPDSVTAIGPYAFRACAFEEIVIPDGVTKLGDGTFFQCFYLTKIVIPDSVTEISEDAFANCSEDLTIYGYEGSYAQTYAEENEINFEIIEEETSTDEDKPLEDKKTGIEVSAADGVIPEGAELKVEPDKDNSDESSVAFDITITTADGKPAAINGTVTVSIPVPDELKGADAYYVFYKADDGTLTDMKATCKDGVITFTTTHFSTYIVSTVNLLADKNTPNSGIEGVAVIAGLAIAAAGAILLTKKRK